MAMRRRHVLAHRTAQDALYGQNVTSLGQSLGCSSGRRLFGVLFIATFLAFLAWTGGMIYWHDQLTGVPDRTPEAGTQR
jgi:hypothetical protein